MISGYRVPLRSFHQSKGTIMLSQETANNLRHVQSQIAEIGEKNLVDRPEWGTVNFEQAREDMQAVISLSEELANLPTNLLPERYGGQLYNAMAEVYKNLRSIDQFSIENDKKTVAQENDRDHIYYELVRTAEALRERALLVIPFLAYRRGDSARRKKVLDHFEAAADKILSVADQKLKEKDDEILDILRKAQDAGASIGVATFTVEFAGEAKKLAKRSRWWLAGAAILGVLTIAAAIGSYFWPPVSNEAGAWETIRNFGSKAAILAVLFTSAVWCGRIYRALVHQAAVNNHRAISLKTFQAFVKATDTPEVRDAVLLAATNAAFGTVPTGLVERSAGEGPTFTVTEISKNAGSRAMRPGSESSD